MIDTPQIGDYTGWQITGQYIMSLRYAHEDFDYMTEVPPDSMPYTEYYLRINYNWYKVVLTMPDGSEHEFRPMDHSPYVAGDSFLHGYYKENPYQNGAMRYYSFDGDAAGPECYPADNRRAKRHSVQLRRAVLRRRADCRQSH